MLKFKRRRTKCPFSFSSSYFCFSRRGASPSANVKKRIIIGDLWLATEPLRDLTMELQNRLLITCETDSPIHCMSPLLSKTIPTHPSFHEMQNVSPCFLAWHPHWRYFDSRGPLFMRLEIPKFLLIRFLTSFLNSLRLWLFPKQKKKNWIQLSWKTSGPLSINLCRLPFKILDFIFIFQILSSFLWNSFTRSNSHFFHQFSRIKFSVFFSKFKLFTNFSNKEIAFESGQIFLN